MTTVRVMNVGELAAHISAPTLKLWHSSRTKRGEPQLLFDSAKSLRLRALIFYR